MRMTCKKKIIREVDGKQVVNIIPAISDDYITKHKLNQQEVVLLHLLNFGYITNKICGDAYGYENGESVIRYLKKDYGVTFDTITKRGLNVVNRYKQKSNYVEYHITNPQLYRGLIG